MTVAFAPVNAGGSCLPLVLSFKGPEGGATQPAFPPFAGPHSHQRGWYCLLLPSAGFQGRAQDEGKVADVTGETAGISRRNGLSGVLGTVREHAGGRRDIDLAWPAPRALHRGLEARGGASAAGGHGQRRRRLDAGNGLKRRIGQFRGHGDLTHRAFGVTRRAAATFGGHGGDGGGFLLVLGARWPAAPPHRGLKIIENRGFRRGIGNGFKDAPGTASSQAIVGGGRRLWRKQHGLRPTHGVVFRGLFRLRHEFGCTRPLLPLTDLDHEGLDRTLHDSPVLSSCSKTLIAGQTCQVFSLQNYVAAAESIQHCRNTEMKPEKSAVWLLCQKEVEERAQFGVKAMNANSASVDPSDLERFERLGATWWDPRGPMRPLHQINPLRLRYGLDQLARQADGPRGLEGLSLLDIGCGGGLFSEALAENGARVTGIDPSEGVIGVARTHAGESGLEIDYRADTAEALAATGAQFDIVCAMEVVEHVVDMPAFVATACSMVKPGGWFFTATLNRTLKSFALAIVGAEYVLRWVPKGTHQWEKFVTPAELEDAIEDGGLTVEGRTGIVFQPLRNTWALSRDTDINYMMCARRL